jgi:hypothetical protein
MNGKEIRDSAREERVRALATFGLTERQARFLVHVLVHAGVFVPRQYCALAGIAHGQKSSDFVARLVERRYAKLIETGSLHRGRLFHVHYKPLYEAIGEPDNRHRKPVSIGRMIERLMLLDGVLADRRRYSWLGTERDKVAYFTQCLNIPHHDLPRITFQSEDGERERTRYFPDKLPIGCERDGGIRHVFLYLVTRDVPVDFRIFLLRHAELMRSLTEWTIRVLIPRRFRKAFGVYRYALRDELAMPLELSTVTELEWFFRERLRRARHPSQPPDRRFDEACRTFDAARFQALYRMWYQQGDAALSAAASWTLQEALACGEGRLEFVELSHQYLHLSSLVGVA